MAQIYQIVGGNRLYGNVKIGGMKNSALPILFASLLCNGTVILESLPQVQDVAITLQLLRSMGAKIKMLSCHRAEIDTRGAQLSKANLSLVQKLRASSYLLGTALARGESIEMPYPGGCNFGERPLDLHFFSLSALGALIENTPKSILLQSRPAIGTKIQFSYPSVGATLNAILGGTLAKGTTIIENAAKEPHIVDCADFLNRCGANIKGAGSGKIQIEGVKSLHGCEYRIRPDMIEAGTYLMMVAGCGGEVEVCNLLPKDLCSVTSLLESSGAKIYRNEKSIVLRSFASLTPFGIKTGPYPEFPTDLQPIATVLACQCKGVGKVEERVWKSRFQYMEELKKTGAEILTGGRTALIFGGKSLQGAQMRATDLRGGAALIFAGLCANGESKISNLSLVERGYESVERKLLKIGANIKTLKTE